MGLWRTCGMRRGHHTRRGGGATLALALWGTSLPAAGQGAVVTQVDELHARTAHRLVESWVWRGGVPGQREEVIRARGLLGVRVTLRLRGVTVGMATAIRPDLRPFLEAADQDMPADQTDTSGLDLITLLEPATTEALNEALATVRQRRGEFGRSAQGVAVELDEPFTPNENRREIDAATLGPRLGVDIQLAYQPERIVLLGLPGESIFTHFAPSHDGLLAVRAQEDSWIWPGTAVAANLGPDRQILRLLVGLGLRGTDRDRLAVREVGEGGGGVNGGGGVPVYRFKVLHLVRPRVDQPVLKLVRGAQLLPARFADDATLRGMTDRIGLHLFGRFIGDGQVRGGYRPSRNLYDPELADDAEASLAAYALMCLFDRKQRDGNAGGVSESYVTVASETVRRVLERVLREPTPKGEPLTEADLAAATFSLLTILQAPAGTFPTDQRDRVAAFLQQRIDDQGQLRLGDQEPETTLSVAAEAACLAALTEVYRRTRQAEIGQAAARLADGLWTRTDGRFDVKALPWIAMSQAVLGGVMVDDQQVDAQVQTQRSETLLNLLPLLGELQVVRRPTLGPSDVIGGIVVQPGPEGSAPTPRGPPRRCCSSWPSRSATPLPPMIANAAAPCSPSKAPPASWANS